MHKIRNFLSYIAIILVVFALICLALPAFHGSFYNSFLETELEAGTNAYTLIFGGKINFELDSEIETFDFFGFSFLNFLSLFFVILGGVFALCGAINKDETLKFFASFCLFVGAILLFLMLINCVLDCYSGLCKDYTKQQLKQAKEQLLHESDLGTGIILSGILTLLAGILIAFECSYEKIFKLITRSSKKSELPISPSTTESTSELNIINELKKYKELLDSGVITQEEFDGKKKQLLDL